MKSVKYSYLFLLIFPATIFTQTTYDGPASGSVTSGVIVTTDNFNSFDMNEHISGEPYEIERLEQEAKPLNLMYDGPVPDNYYYVEGGTKQNGIDIGESFELHSFESIGYQSLNPPDPAMSVGPNHVIAAINNRFHIYDRDGNLLKNISEATWVAQIVNTPVISDPQVIYDHYNSRWVMLWFTRDSGILQAPFVICYSDDENPLGTWYMYAINSELNGSTYAGNWGDYPKMGYDDQAIYIASRQFRFDGGGRDYSKIRILNSNELYAALGGPISWTDIWNIRVNGNAYDVITPYFSYGPGQNSAYFVYSRQSSSSPSSFYQLFKITDPITNPVLTSTAISSTTYYRAPSADQLGGNPVDNFTWMCKAPVLRDGLLYASHAIRNSQNAQYSSIKYFIIDVNSNTLTEEVEQGEEGYFFIQPAITVDKDHNIAITYSKSSSSTYIGAYYSTRLSTDPPGLSASKVMTEGQSTQNGSTRWGDYFAAVVDPVNQYDIWLFCEFAKNGDWSTWLTELRMKPFAGVHAYSTPNSIDFGDVEIGTTSSTYSTVLANYGDSDLIISNIPSSVGDYNLVTNLSFPDTLSSYDSLTIEFNYSPTVVGNSSILYDFTTNDPDFQGITLTGNCYQIVPASEKTIYASSGPQNDGNIITINPSTGSGSILGESLFPEVNGLAINPLNGIMYGLVAPSGSSEIVRVNSEFGNSYSLFSVNIPAIADIAFDTLGTFYGIGVNGELYEIDLSNGDVTFVVDAEGNYSGITFNQQTNELWATSRSILPPNKDAVFKVNILTGDTTIIGHTGLNKVTNDLVFDENLNLYGVVGTTSELNDFISINPNDGTGTIIGSVGMKAILGLAYIGSSPTSVEYDGEDYPMDYALLQNYPNPFNPNTRIDFSLPMESSVKLVIYNILGQEVVRLVENEMTSGNHSFTWSAEDATGKQLTSGIYLYKLSATGIDGSEFNETKKMILLK